MAGGSERRSSGDPRWIAYLGAVASIVTIVGFLFSFGILRFPSLSSSADSGSHPGGSTSRGNSPTVPAGQVDPTAKVTAAYTSFCAAVRKNQLQRAFDVLTPQYQQNVGAPSALPDAVGGSLGRIPEHAQDCTTFFPVKMDTDGKRGVELGEVTVTNQTVGQRTITRNFEFILTSGKWLLNNVYASRDAVLCWLCWNVKPASTTNASGKYWHQGWLAASGYRQHGCPRMSEQAADRYLRTGAAAEVEGKLS